MNPFAHAPEGIHFWRERHEWAITKLTDFKGRTGVEITGPLTAESRAADWMTVWNQSWPFD